MKKNSIVYKITKVIVDITLVIGVICSVMAPLYINYIGGEYDYSLKTEIILSVALVLCGVLAVYILWQVRKILKNVLKDNPFTEDTIKSLRKMAICSAVIDVVLLVKIIFIPAFASCVLVFAFGFATLLFLTLKDLFKQALFYKEENEGVI